MFDFRTRFRVQAACSISEHGKIKNRIWFPHTVKAKTVFDFRTRFFLLNAPPIDFNHEVSEELFRNWLELYFRDFRVLFSMFACSILLWILFWMLIVEEVIPSNSFRRTHTLSIICVISASFLVSSNSFHKVFSYKSSFASCFSDVLHNLRHGLVSIPLWCPWCID